MATKWLLVLWLLMLLPTHARLPVTPTTPGDLDPTFDGDGLAITSFFDKDGRVITSFGGAVDTAQSVVVQNDGKIVVAGYSYEGSDGDWYMALARYQADGSLDTSFDEDALVITDFSTGFAVALAIALQPDGKIVAAGGVSSYGTQHFALVRY